MCQWLALPKWLQHSIAHCFEPSCLQAYDQIGTVYYIGQIPVAVKAYLSE